jgi:hypothetical protein
MTEIFEHHPRPKRRKVIALMLLGVVGFVALVFAVDFGQRVYIYSKARGQVQLFQPFRDSLLNAYFSIPFSARKRELSKQTELPVYELQISEKNMAELEYTRKKIAATGFKWGIPREYVPAEFKLNGEWVQVKLKLRGQTYFHYTKTRPSLRINFRGHNTLGGYDEINVIDPYDKGITADIVTAEYLRKYGLLINPSQFVVLKINGEVSGLYQEFAQFGRGLLDQGGRPEGHIFDGAGKHYGKEGDGLHIKAKPAVEELKSCLKNKVCSEDFLNHRLQVQKFARALAMTTLLGSDHAWVDVNLKVYFDPARGQFEPIPWDYSFYKIPAVSPSLDEIYKDTYGEALLKDPRIRAYHDIYLWELLGHYKEVLQASQELFDRLKNDLVLDTRHIDFYRDQKQHEAVHEAVHHNAELLKARYFVNGEPKAVDHRLLYAKAALAIPAVPNVVVSGFNVKFQNEVVLKKSISIPYGYKVEFAPGLKLRLARGVSLLIRGDLKALGWPQSPIKISGWQTSDWGALAVHGTHAAPSRVQMAHVEMEGGTGFETPFVIFTGAFSAHDAVMDIQNSRFHDARGIDGLNFKYAKVDFSHSQLSGSADDGFDMDFCTVRVRQSQFRDTGGDCADFSGSDADVADSTMTRCGDKGISIGEATLAKVENVRIHGAATGVAIKDKSNAKLNRLLIEDAAVGVSAYIKKVTFGPPKGEIEGVQFLNVKTETLITHRSDLKVMTK